MKWVNTTVITGLALLAAMLGAGCDAWLTKPSLYSTVHVAVTGANGEGLPDVPLELYTGQRPMDYGVTGSDGLFTFTSVPPGTYGVSATRPLYYRDFNQPGDSAGAVRVPFTVAADSADTVVFALPRCAGTVMVTVRDQTGAPVAHTPAALYDSRGLLGATGMTDNSGNVAIAAPCAVQFGISVNFPPGYGATAGRGTTYVDGLTVTNGQVVQADFLFVKQ